MSETDVYIHNYKLLNKLGKGAFSTVFRGVHRIQQKMVAIKIEKEATTLKHESKIISYLNRELTSSENIPTLYWYGLYGNNACMATTYYDTNLQDYIEKIWSSPEPFIKLLGLCEKLIHVIRQVHSAYIVHSDIKPDNFMIDGRETLVIIDFGLSSLFYNSQKDVYKENKKGENIIGSPKYASYNLHLGNGISCRDDLLSIGYMMMTIFKIEIPWSNMEEQESLLSLCHIRHPTNIQRAKYKNFEMLKKYLDILAERNHSAKHFIVYYLIPYFEKIYALNYEDNPDHLSYKSMFITLY